MKTQARSVLDGDFLYLDADTVPVGEFDELLLCQAPISAAIDRNRALPDGGFPPGVIADFEKMRWSYPTEFYLNGGVVFWKDCDEARALGRLWHETWQHFVAMRQNPADQPSFNHCISALKLQPQIMDDAFNARVGVSPEYADGARIYHFYCQGDEKPEGTIFDALVAGYRATGEVDFTLIDQAGRGHVWLEEIRTHVGHAR